MSEIMPFILSFDVITGLCKNADVKPIKRRVSDMADQFADKNAAIELIKDGDPLLYEFYGLDLPDDDPGILQFGTTIIYPGKVGNEYFMTKGHFHSILDTSEIYYCLGGHGMMLMETMDGQVEYKYLSQGDAIYVPGGWAHRSINTSDEPFVMFFVYRADAGHDYGTIEEKGYRKLVIEENGKPTIVDNPRWKSL